MTTKEEIREEVAEFLWSRGWQEGSRFFPFSALAEIEKESPYWEGTRQAYLAKVDKLLSYLHSQGVVIKVKCPDCEWSQFEDEVVGMTPCHSCNSTGYRIEPLIEEISRR